MSYFFTETFRTALSATPGLISGATLKLALFRQAPEFAGSEASYTSVTNVANLLTRPGWVEVTGGGYPLSGSLTGTVLNQGSAGHVNHYVLFTQFPFTGLAATEVEAVAVVYQGTLGGVTNPIIFVTDTPFSTGPRAVENGDGITAPDDSNITGASKKWLFSWADPPTGTTQITTLQEGALKLYLGAPAFEPSHTQHVWLYPQRANLIANPSFEATGTDYWSSNGAIARTSNPHPPLGAGAFYGSFAGASGKVIAESNKFPMLGESMWTVQLLASGTGTLKVGVVWWPDDYEYTSVDWGDNEQWVLSPSTFAHISVVRNTPEGAEGMVRLELDGTDLKIDQVLCERGYLKEWPYFDGDSTYGARDDYSWYGGASRRGASYSFWYNNKRAIYGRMFDRDIDSTELITDEVMAAQGFVYRWVPAGTFIMAHMDVLYPNDLQLPVAPKPAGVIPYKDGGANKLSGVTNPWV